MSTLTQFLLMFQFDKIDVDGNGTIDIDEVVPRESMHPSASLTWTL